MPLKRYRSKKPVSRKPRRRLQPVKTAVSLVPKVAAAIAKSIPRVRKAYQVGKVLYNAYTSRNKQYQKRNLSSDNITTLPITTIGKARPLSFDERVARVERGPISFKRNFEFTVEGTSGRKAWFSMEFNRMTSDDLNADLTTYKSQQYTDTASADPTVSVNANTDGAKFYVDYLSEKLNIMNSSSNSITGKIHLFVHKRDTSNAYNSTVPITPINLMMYYSTNRLPLNVTANEAVVNNGWKFDTATSSVNYNAVYNMPGSSSNPSGVSAWTDSALSPSSPHIKESMDFWFRKVDTYPFSLKAGQQINKSYVFHDLKDIFREEQHAYVHIAGVSFSCVVEFQGQIVGSSTTSDVSTGFSQLSIMRTSVRQLGIKNKLKPKTYLVTSAPVNISIANNEIINPDTGATDTNVDYNI